MSKCFYLFLLFLSWLGPSNAFSPRMRTGYHAFYKEIKNGSLPSDLNFDPLGLSNIKIFEQGENSTIVRWSGGEIGWISNIESEAFLDKKNPITTLEWMRDAELKHGRICMLAFVGITAVDLGLRLPDTSKYTFSSIPSSYMAHDICVHNGSLGILLFIVSILEAIGFNTIYEQARGSGRVTGDFNFDPFGLSQYKASLFRYKEYEVSNGRLAMLAIAGIVAQLYILPDSMKVFPYF